MTRFEQVLANLKTSWLKVVELPSLEAYILRGEPKALGRIQPKDDNWNWTSDVAKALSRPNEWTDQDRRAAHALTAAGKESLVLGRLDAFLPTEAPGEDLLQIVLREIPGRTPETCAILIGVHINTCTIAGRPTSAGRHLLDLNAKTLKAVALNVVNEGRFGATLAFILDAAKAKVPDLAPFLLGKAKPDRVPPLAALLLKTDGRHEGAVAERFARTASPPAKFSVGKPLAALNLEKYGPAVLDAARAAFAFPGTTSMHAEVGAWMIEHFPRDTAKSVAAFLERDGADRHKLSLLQDAPSGRWKEATPVLRTALKSKSVEIRQEALKHLIAANDGSQDDSIEPALREGFLEPNSAHVLPFLTLADQWKPDRIEKEIWSLLDHKSRPIRGRAARVLGKLGDKALRRAQDLLAARKADAREAAVRILSAINSPTALKALEARLDAEPDDDVRDAILRALSTAWEKSGRKVGMKEIQERVARAAERSKEPPTSWIKPDRLPSLKFSDGSKVDAATVRYLLYRQSRAKEIKADLEAEPLLRMIDRSSSGNFAATLLEGFIASGSKAEDRWALAMAGLLGDDRIVPVLSKQIREWADSSRGKLAEYAVQALALLGSDPALVLVDALAIRYRTKYKNIGKAAVEAFAAAAEAAGLTPDELGDKVVPFLGFEPGKPRIVKAGEKRIQVSIGADFKQAYTEVESKKKLAALPKGIPADAVKEFKELAAALKEIVKAQLLRLENLMVRQRRWDAGTWRRLFVDHPVLAPFSQRLVWAAYDGKGKLKFTFRALEDRSLTNSDDDGVELPKDALIGIVHPLELDEAVRKQWIVHLADHEAEPPFPQLERPVVLANPEHHHVGIYQDLVGTSLNGLTFKGRAERLGWTRGSVADAGCIPTYRKGFPAAGIEAILWLEGMYIGIDMYTNIELAEALFVRSGTVTFGSYTYDEPRSVDDRVVLFGDVPPIVFSEAMGDLRKIAGGKDAAASS